MNSRLGVPAALCLGTIVFVYAWLNYQPGPPELVIVHPKPGEVFDGIPVYIELDVRNFKLVPPIPFFGPTTNDRAGHIHITMDNLPIFATAQPQCMIGKMMGNEHVPRGQHALRVELVKINHESLSHRIVRIVVFRTAGDSAIP